MKKDLLSINDLTVSEIEEIFTLAKDIKTHKFSADYKPLNGKNIALIFFKASTRTRVSFEAGISQLGGYPLFLDSKDLQLNRGEPISDTAKVLSGYVDGIVFRGFSHEDLIEFAKYATIPVINALTDLLHPCQILTDIFTIKEKKGSLDNIKIAYIGDGNNIANSWINGATKLGLRFIIACPKEYKPDQEILKNALRTSSKAKIQKIEVVHDPIFAVKGADVIYTDVWTSMGQEVEKEKRLSDFQGFQVNIDLLKKAKNDMIVMHCLPAHRGEEITAEVVDGPQSVIFEQAHNRLYVQKAILIKLFDLK
ncbi:MAG: ornithine carbamoyltransferase [bacterium]